MRLQSTLQRITTWLAIVGYAVVASGLPLPCGGEPTARDPAVAKRLAGKDRSKPFPCMDKPCGCATAEQCFSNCCCKSRKKAAPSCCASKAADEPEQPPRERPDPPRVGTVVLRAMLACGGIVAEWFAAAGGLPPPIVECRFPFPCIECLAVVDEFDEQPHFSPAAPPPRAG